MRSAALGMLLIGLAGCAHQGVQTGTPTLATLDPKSLPRVYQLLAPNSLPNSQDIEALLIQKDGTFNIAFSNMNYGYYTVGKWTVEGNRIHLYPAAVDQKDRAKTEADLQSGKIPETEREKLEAMLKDRTLTPVFEKGSDAPKLLLDAPDVERLIEPQFGTSPIYLIPQG